MCYLPLGADDPKSKGIISDLVIALFNGLKGATMKCGERLPTSMAVNSSNFTTVYRTGEVRLINPRHADTRVTVMGLCVCVSVSLPN